MPYAHFYLDNINKKNEIHLAYWNRDCKPEDTSAFLGVHLHEFSLFMVNDAPLKIKIKCFAQYRSFVKSILEKDHFDFIVVLHSLSGLIIYDYLKKKKNQFILDYRDSTYESKSKLFAKLVQNICQWSRVTFVSSDAFRKFLPINCKDKIITSHNLLEESIDHREYHKAKSDKIRLAFWGFIRDYEINRMLISRIAIDPRFELHYYGREQKDAIDLKKYVHSINANNVFFHGEYNPEDRYEFIKHTDLIHNIYCRSNETMAMTNKYYDSIIFRIPQICQIASFMGQTACECGVGTMLNPNKESFCEDLFLYYFSLNMDNFKKSCDKELERVYKEYTAGKKIISELTK